MYQTKIQDVLCPCAGDGSSSSPEGEEELHVVCRPLTKEKKGAKREVDNDDILTLSF